MSEQKKVIHVKDLVIKADNVRFEPSRRPVDPFFGPRRRREEGEENQETPKSENEQSEDEEEKSERRRPPLFWL